MSLHQWFSTLEAQLLPGEIRKVTISRLSPESLLFNFICLLFTLKKCDLIDLGVDQGRGIFTISPGDPDTQ